MKRARVLVLEWQICPFTSQISGPLSQFIPVHHVLGDGSRVE